MRQLQGEPGGQGQAGDGQHGQVTSGSDLEQDHQLVCLVNSFQYILLIVINISTTLKYENSDLQWGGSCQVLTRAVCGSVCPVTSVSCMPHIQMTGESCV